MPGAVAFYFIARHFQGLALRRQHRVVGQRQLMPGVVVGRGQGERGKALVQRCQVVDVDALHADQRAQLPERGVLLIQGLDLFGGGQLIAGLGFKDIGASALALLEQMPVLLELLFERLLLGPGDVDLVLGEQRLGVIAQHPHQQRLALVAKAFIGKQRLGYALAVVGIGFVVEQRLLQAEGRAVAVVVAVVAVTAAAPVRQVRFGVVAAFVVVVGQPREQAGAANGAVFQAGVALLDGAEEHRVVAQRLLVHIEGPHRGLGTATHQQQRNEHWLHAHSSVNAEPARSSSGLNR